MLSAEAKDIHKQYTELSSQIGLVVLHPAAKLEQRLLKAFLLNTTTLIYMHLPHVSDSAQSFHKQLIAPIKQYFCPEIVEPQSLTEALDTLAKCIRQKPHVTLFWEGYEENAFPEFDQFIPTLVKTLPLGSRIILGGRQLPIKLILDETLEERIAVLPHEQASLWKQLTQNRLDADHKLLEVHAFGQGYVTLNGFPIHEWEGTLPRTLFFYFIDRAIVTRDDIFKTFWPRLANREATNVFHVTKRKVHEILGVSLIAHGNGFYRISNAVTLDYDVIKFQEAVSKAAISSPEESLKLYHRAINLYREDFLNSIENHIEIEWIKRRRDEMRKTFAEALIGLGRIYEQKNDLERALGVFSRATVAVPQREDLIREVMLLQATLGYPKRAIETFEQFRLQLRQTLHVTPDPLTMKLAADIQQQL